MRFYLRAISYFRADAGKIAVILLLIALYSAAGLLQAYPLAILIDSVIQNIPSKNWIYRAFFAIAPDGKLGQIITLALFVLALRLIQEIVSLGRTLLNIQLGYNG